MELIPLLMFVAVGVTLLSGYPVAFCLGGVALIFAAGGLLGGSRAVVIRARHAGPVLEHRHSMRVVTVCDARCIECSTWRRVRRRACRGGESQARATHNVGCRSGWHAVS